MQMNTLYAAKSSHSLRNKLLQQHISFYSPDVLLFFREKNPQVPNQAAPQIVICMPACQSQPVIILIHGRA
jgi:hypothetical protein